MSWCRSPAGPDIVGPEVMGRAGRHRKAVYPRVLDTNQGELSGQRAELTGRTRPGGCIAEASNGNSPPTRAWWSMTQVWFQPIYLSFFFFTFIIYMHVCGHSQAMVYQWESEDKVWESVPSFPSVGFRDPTQFIGLAEKHRYLQSHLTRSSLEFPGLRKRGHYPHSTGAEGRLGVL